MTIARARILLKAPAATRIQWVMRTFFILILLFATTARAEVYKCMVAGKAVYTDRPCNAAAAPAKLPPINTEQPHASDDLVKNHDERQSRALKARDESNAAFLKAQGDKAAREKSVRAAIIDHRVVKGMTATEVESALGRADEKRPDGSWLFLREGLQTTVRFEDGRVSGLSSTSGRQKK